MLKHINTMRRANVTNGKVLKKLSPNKALIKLSQYASKYMADYQVSGDTSKYRDMFTSKCESYGFPSNECIPGLGYGTSNATRILELFTNGGTGENFRKILYDPLITDFGSAISIASGDSKTPYYTLFFGYGKTEFQFSTKGMLKLVNERRTASNTVNGTKLGMYSMNQALNKCADYYSGYMAKNNYFDHTQPDGTEPWQRCTQRGYPTKSVGENIARGHFLTMEDVMVAWMNSPGHRAAILNPDFDEFGCGAVNIGKGRPNVYLTQNFGRSSKAAVKSISQDTKQVKTPEAPRISKVSESRPSPAIASPKPGSNSLPVEIVMPTTTQQRASMPSSKREILNRGRRADVVPSSNKSPPDVTIHVQVFKPSQMKEFQNQPTPVSGTAQESKQQILEREAKLRQEHAIRRQQEERARARA
jgi:uncharacterized protein YkwD